MLWFFVRPMIESVLLGVIAGMMGQVLLPEGTMLSSGVVPGLMVGIVGGIVLAFVRLRTDTRSNPSVRGRRRVLGWTTASAAAAFWVMTLWTSNPQIAWSGRVLLCSGVAIIYGFLTHRALGRVSLLFGEVFGMLVVCHVLLFCRMLSGLGLSR
ncbi:putative membrane protein YeaQ/YmgE (transglycosylase-associated protein family) [Arthrobacter sp. CAN_A1]